MISDIDEMEMVYVPEGKFLMGSANSDNQAQDHEFPQHIVSLDSFWIDRTEVTNAMYAVFVEQSGYVTQTETDRNGFILSGSKWVAAKVANWRRPRGTGSSYEGLLDHPVVQVTWEDAYKYCEWAGRRLPTEAEWEKAARGTNGQVYPWGDQLPDGSRANLTDSNLRVEWADKSLDDGYSFTSPVGNFPKGASPYGGLDMAGNVWEWVTDWYGEDYYANSPSSNPTGPGQSETRVLKGGSWHGYNSYLRSAARGAHMPNLSYDSHGFRCALDAE